MKTKYGDLSSHQIAATKQYLQKSIFHLLLYVDPNESYKYPQVDVNEAFAHVFSQLVGFNKILLEPPEVLITMNFLEAALDLYNSEGFVWQRYRKLVLDAGAEIMEIKEGGRHVD